MSSLHSSSNNYDGIDVLAIAMALHRYSTCRGMLGGCLTVEQSVHVAEALLREVPTLAGDVHSHPSCVFFVLSCFL